MKSITHDTASNDLLEKLSKFGRDFALDSQHRLSPLIIQDSLVQMKNLLIPIIKEQIIAIKIPNIKKSNENYDLEVDRYF